jgi:hypothetical protein
VEDSCGTRSLFSGAAAIVVVVVAVVGAVLEKVACAGGTAAGLFVTAFLVAVTDVWGMRGSASGAIGVSVKLGVPTGAELLRASFEVSVTTTFGAMLSALAVPVIGGSETRVISVVGIDGTAG